MNRHRTWWRGLAMIALVLYATMAFAAGTVTQTISPIGGGYVVTFTWTGDAADGSVPNTATSTDATTAIAGLFLARVETNPGATAPTDNYDITILAASGVDLMAGALANRDTSNTEIAYPATSSPLVDGALTLTLSGNSVNSAVGTVKLYFTRSPTAGTGAGGGGGGAVTNAGSFAVQEDGAALTALQLIDNAVSGAGFNITQQAGAALPAPAALATGMANPTAPAVGAFLMAWNGTTWDRVPIDSIVDPVKATPVAFATGGASTAAILSAASDNATSVKASAGKIYGIELINTTSTIYFFKLYNLAAAPTCNSATGFVRSIPIPHGTGAGGGIISTRIDVGADFTTGFAYCICGGTGASTDGTSAATGIFGAAFYK